MATNETSPASETVLDTAGPTQPIVVKEEGNGENRTSSPDPSCSICLDNVTDAAYTDMCCHRFCFQCLVNWSRVKPECPLCKQRFSLIIHNVRSIGDYDELPVTWQDPPAPSLDANFLISVAFQRPRFRYRTTAGWSWRFHNLLGGPSSMSIANPIMPSSSINPATTTATPISSLSGSVIMPITTAAHMFPPVNSNTYMGNTVAMEWRRRRQVSASEFRNTIYQHNQWVVPPPRNGVPYRVRECSPSFYRNNPAQVNRLIPWLHRELLVLLDRWENYEEICQRVLDAITEVPIRSQRFHALMWPHLHDRTAHFIHEFYHFAISPYEMLAYDLRAEYVRHSPLLSDQPLSEHEINSDSSDIEVIETPEVRPELIEISDEDDDPIRVTEGGNDSDASVEIISTLPPLALREPETIDLLDTTSSSDNDTQDTQDFNIGARNTQADDLSSAPLNNPDIFSYSCLFDMREPTGERLRNKCQPYYKDESSSTEEEVPRRRQLRKRKRKSEFPKKRKRIIKDYSSSNNSESEIEIQERLKPSSYKTSSNASKELRKTRLQTKRKSKSPVGGKQNSNKSCSSSTATSSERKNCKKLKKSSQPSSSQSKTKILSENNELNTPEHVSVSSPVLPQNPYDSDLFIGHADLSIDGFDLNASKDSSVNSNYNVANEEIVNISRVNSSVSRTPSPYDAVHLSDMLVSPADVSIDEFDLKPSKSPPLHSKYNKADDENVNSAVNSSESRTPSPKPRLKSVVKKIEPSQEAGCSNWPLHNLRQRKVTRYAYTPYFSISDSDS